MCQSIHNTKVVDGGRNIKNNFILRRRRCLVCGERFSTIEFEITLSRGRKRRKDRIKSLTEDFICMLKGIK